jgi:GNAT superfamily N-acetyltransferase
MLQIRDIAVHSLTEFIESEEFRRMEHIPISPRRALSHSKNPCATPDDKVLFLAYEDGRFAGYLGALPDVFYTPGCSHKVAWLSCMWVDPAMRRHGIAFKLLQHAFEVWESNLLISNFIPKSKAAFDKTGLFQPFKDRKGLRGYLRFDGARIMITKKPVLQKISWLLKTIDGILNVLNEARFLFRRNIQTDLHAESLSFLDEATIHFIAKHNQHHLTRKNQDHFSWIRSYPWVIEEPYPDKDAIRYDFSSSDKRFRQYFVTLSNTAGSPVAFLMLSLRGNHLKTPFAYIESGNEGKVLRYLYAYMIQQKVRTFTTYHPELVHTLKTSHNPFILTRTVSMESIITPGLLAKLGNTDDYYLQDGDGDAAFT